MNAYFYQNIFTTVKKILGVKKLIKFRSSVNNEILSCSTNRKMIENLVKLWLHRLWWK